MPCTFNFLLALFCLGFPTGETFKIKTVLSNNRIKELLEKVENKVIDTPEYWDDLYVKTGAKLLPVTKLAANAPARTVIGGFIGLAAHNGPVLNNLNILAGEGLVESVVVVFSPTGNVGRGDHKACVKILEKLKTKGVKVYNFENEATTQEHTDKSGFKFNGFLDGVGVTKVLNSVNCLIVSLCGVTVANKKGDEKGTSKLYEALNLLPVLTEGKPRVLSLNSKNGQADDNTWPFKNKHKCTHLPTQYWPMGSLKGDKGSGTRNFILNSDFLARLDTTEVKKDLAALKGNKFFKKNGYVEVEYREP